MSSLTRERDRMRLRTAFVVWGMLAIVSWVVVLVPAYFLIDRGPALVQAWFGDDEAAPEQTPPTTIANKPDDDDALSPAQVKALGRLAPAAGGNQPIRPVDDNDD